MSLVNEVGSGIDGLSQLRALMASGRKPGISASLSGVGCRVSFRPIPRPGVPASGAPEELLRVDRGPSM
jgi:hypothetical protein